jgi:hypothetical protein
MIVIVVGLIIVLVVAGAAAYYFVTNPSPPTPTSTGHSTTTTTTSAVHSSTASSSTTTTGPSGLKTYSGTFNFSLPEGPFGEMTFTTNDTVLTYNSVQVGSGSFTFSINPANYSGSGSGHGTLTVTTTGFCSGHVTFPYTFQIPDATTILGNLTVFVGTPTPANFTVPLTCRATPNSSSQNGETFPFLSTYPNELSVAAVPVVVTQHLSGNISYSFTINPTN